MDTTFTDQQTKIVAAWLNDVNIAVYRALSAAGVAPATAADVVTNLGPTLLTYLGLSGTATAVGDALFTTTSVSNAQDTLGGTTVGKALFTAASVAAALSTLGTRAKLQVFTSTGTYTPTTGMTACLCILQGAGGGGEGAPTTGAGEASTGSPGQAGELAISLLTAANIGASRAVTIGAAGTHGVAGGVAATGGGDSSLGVLLKAAGGPSGVAHGPTATIDIASSFTTTSRATGQIYTKTRGGYINGWADSVGRWAGLAGPNSFLGSGVGPGRNGSIGTANAQGYGAGGAGSHNAASEGPNTLGADGGPAILLVIELF